MQEISMVERRQDCGVRSRAIVAHGIAARMFYCVCGCYRNDASVAGEGVNVASAGVEENVAGPLPAVGAACDVHVAGSKGRARLERHQSARSPVGVARGNCDLTRFRIGHKDLSGPDFDAARTSVLIYSSGCAKG